MNYSAIIDGPVPANENEPGVYFTIRATFVVGNDADDKVDPTFIPKKALDAMIDYLVSQNTWEDAFAGEIEVIEIVGSPNIEVTKRGIQVEITLKLSEGDEDEIETWMEVWNDKGIWQTHFPTEINFRNVNSNRSKRSNNNLTVHGYKFIEIRGIHVDDVTEWNQNGGKRRRTRRTRRMHKTRKIRRNHKRKFNK